MPEVTLHRRTFAERHRTALLAIKTGGLILLLGLLAPEQMPVLQYKLTLPALGGVLFYWIDRALWPFAQPESYLEEDWLTSKGEGDRDEPDYPVSTGYQAAFLVACIRQVGMVAVGALGLALGL